jgi:predicted ATPase
LENFALPISGRSSALLIGKNGSGKSSVGLALEILQKIARGANRVDEVVRPKDLSRGRIDAPMRFEIEALVGGQTYKYYIAFDFPPEEHRKLKVFEEGLAVDDKPVFTRAGAQVFLAKTNQEKEAKFLVDWFRAALPIIQERTTKDPLFIFRQWLASMVILRPVPSMINGNSEQETLEPNTDGTDLGAWFSGLVASEPAAYANIYGYLKEVMPDLKVIRNPVVGKDARSLDMQFSNDVGNLSVPFSDLSDGEKCFMICAMVLAANAAYGPLVCFWDEPDNYLALSEVGHFVIALRKAFQSGGQFITTSHNPEAIRRFSEENTLVLYRKNHLEPTNVRPLDEISVNGELVGALIRGDLEP